MSKTRIQFRCAACGFLATRWSGQCPECGEWNTFSEERALSTKIPKRSAGGYSGQAQVLRLDGVKAEITERIPTGMQEFDRVLGGGLVPGSVVLIGGDPGIGKSTLLLQVADFLSRSQSILYVTGEESPSQVALRASRLDLDSGSLNLAAETRVEAILEILSTQRPTAAVIDSVQTLYSESLSSAPGSVSQLRESTSALVRHAKESGVALFLVGHVTKQGAIAGPRVLEHMVDTVLYFENDSGSRFRAIRAVKNRFGSANELGVFAMTESGLKEVRNPSAIFLSRAADTRAGSVVTVLREGTRPLLIEVQALVDESQLSNPRRVTVGYDVNRLGMLLAVLHRHAGSVLYSSDVYVNLVGGLRTAETGIDLAIAAALVSSQQDTVLPSRLIVFGEVGLGGEIRPVFGGEERLAEAAAQGFSQAIVPAANAPRKKSIKGLQVHACGTLMEALRVIG